MTSLPPGWWEGYFDERFVDLYAAHLPQEMSAAEAAAVAEILSLPAGARILDLGCGWGRHSLELARLGYRVTAVDQSEILLRHGQRLAARDGLEVDWVLGDFRRLAWRAEFDAVLSLFSSLGYSLRDEDDVQVLRAARSALAPEGSLVLDTMHRDQVVREFAERDWWEGPGGEPVWVEREFDAVRGVSREWLRWLSDGVIGEKYHEIRVRTATEWVALLRAAELDVLACYGGWDFDPLDLHSDRLILVAGAA